MSTFVNMLTVDLLIINKNLDTYNFWRDGQPNNGGDNGEDCAEVINYPFFVSSKYVYVPYTFVNSWTDL